MNHTWILLFSVRAKAFFPLTRKASSNGFFASIPYAIGDIYVYSCRSLARSYWENIGCAASNI